MADLGQTALARIFNYVSPDAVVTWDLELPGGGVTTYDPGDTASADSITFVFGHDYVLVRIPYCWDSWDTKPTSGDQYLMTPTVDGVDLNTLTLTISSG